MKNPLNKKITIGILGGGQLARMSAYQAYRMGYNISIWEKEKDAPAGMLTKKEFVGDINDDGLIKAFANCSDIITLENEFIDTKRLKFIEKLGKKVIPNSKTIGLIQDKFIQKKTFHLNHLPLPNFLDVRSENDFSKIKKILSLPFLLKSRKLGYDGYGNALIKNESDFKLHYKRLTTRHSKLLAEEFIDFKKELAIMVCRTKNELKCYPVVETIQKNHICFMVIAPAQINKKIRNEVQEIGIEAVKSINGYGIFGIEFFLTRDNKILINEIAPRPHNSGHYTIDACKISQFENHIRAVLNLPLGSTEMINKYAVMINLLGKKNDLGIVENYKKTLKYEDVHLHIYGKENSRIGRKMGHITLVGNNLNDILKRTKEIEKQTII